MPTANNDPRCPDREDTVVSPRIAALYHLTPRVSVWGDIGAGFRAPTLNELYRQFRVGTVLTLANNQLGPERLVGGELGVTVVPTSNVLLRSTYFDNRVKDPVSNVTIAIAGANVTQQRQNLGRTRIRGLQNDAEVRFGASWRFVAGVSLRGGRGAGVRGQPGAGRQSSCRRCPSIAARCRSSTCNPKLADLAFAIQSIGHAVRRRPERADRARALRSRACPATPWRRSPLHASIGRNFEAFFGVQNLFDEDYFVGTLPTSVGSPRLVTGGVRVRFAGRPQAVTSNRRAPDGSPRSSTGAARRSGEFGFGSWRFAGSSECLGSPLSLGFAIEIHQMPLYLGLDSSTQSLTAIVIDSDTRRWSFEDVPELRRGAAALRHASRRAATCPSGRGDVVSGDVGGGAGRDVRPARGRAASIWQPIAAISGSAQQHGSVYLNARAAAGARRARSGAAAGRAGRADVVARRRRRSGWTRAPRPSARRSPRRSAAPAR